MITALPGFGLGIAEPRKPWVTNGLGIGVSVVDVVPVDGSTDGSSTVTGTLSSTADVPLYGIIDGIAQTDAILVVIGIYGSTHGEAFANAILYNAIYIGTGISSGYTIVDSLALDATTYKVIVNRDIRYWTKGKASPSLSRHNRVKPDYKLSGSPIKWNSITRRRDPNCDK